MKKILNTIIMSSVIIFTMLVFSGQTFANSYKLDEIKGKTIGAPCSKQNSQESPYRTTVYFDSKYKFEGVDYDNKKMTIAFGDGNAMADLGYKMDSSLVITPNKPGRANVTVRLKDRKKAIKIKFTVFSYYYSKSPFKSIKFNGKKIEYIDYLRCYQTVTIGSNKKGSLSVKLRKGWSLKNVKKRKANGKLVKASLSKKVKIGKKEYLILTLKDSKGKEVLYEIHGTLN